MAARSVWKGFIRFSLVTVPVKAYNANNAANDISFNQLHNQCKSRIQYKKTCPIHGEIPNDQIVNGYEFTKGQYVVVDKAELEKLRTPADRAVNIKAFIAPSELDPAYYTGKSYYLAPDGPIGQKSYWLLLKGMAEADVYGFAQVVLNGREQLVVLRPVKGILAMSVVSFDAEVKKPQELSGEVLKVETNPQELKLARTLIEALRPEEFDLTQYRDTYAENVAKLVEAKVQGKEIVAPAEQDAPQLINLMEALEKSVAQTRRSGKPPKLVAPGSAAKAKDSRKRKSS